MNSRQMVDPSKMEKIQNGLLWIKMTVSCKCVLVIATAKDYSTLYHSTFSFSFPQIFIPLSLLYMSKRYK